MTSVRTRVFKNGNSQAVRLPRELAFDQPDQEVTVTRTGDVITIQPVRPSVQEMLAKLRALPQPSTPWERLPFEARDWFGLDDEEG